VEKEKQPKFFYTAQQQPTKSSRNALTMFIVSCEISFVDEEIMILVQLPELAVDDVEVLVREIVHDLIDVLLLFQ